MRRFLPRILAPRLRQRIRNGLYTPQGLRRAFARCSDGKEGFDSLDLIVAPLLNEGEPGEPQVVLEKDMVAYQPTPARVVLELLELTGLKPEDLLIDLGSGLGHVCLLAALLSGCRARGVELEPAYCAYAARTAQALNLRGVDFVCADARAAPLEGASVYFLFTPFRGALLQQVVRRLPPGARIAAHGPCINELSALERLPGGREVALFVAP